MRAFPLALLILLLASGAAGAQDALRGKLLYHDAGRLRASGVSCIDCHGGLPRALHGIERAAGDPARIAYAVGAIPQMAPLRERLSPDDMADLAAYLAAPGIPSPALSLSTSGPAASPYSAERLEFPPAPAAAPSPPSRIVVTNSGALPLRLVSGPALGGPDAAAFAVSATDCAGGSLLAPGRSCSVDVLFKPEGAPGLRAASLGLAHDWIRGGVNVALIGRVRAEASPGIAR